MIKCLPFLFILFITGVFVTPLSGQSFSNEFQYYSLNEGLSNAYVHAIAQDKKGYIWIGTEDGLNKFNGYEMEVYRNDPSQKSSIINNSINALLNDDKGNLWIATEEGLDIYNPDLNNFKHVKNSAGKRISTIFQSADSNIWIGTTNGIARYSKEKNELVKVYFNAENSNQRFDDNEYPINVFNEFDSRYLVAGTWNGILVIDRKTNSVQAVANTGRGTEVEHISSMDIDGNKNIWIGTYGNGLFHFDMLRKSITKIKISDHFSIDNRVLSVYNDGEGHIWLGTEQSGLVKLYINSYSIDGYEYEHFIDDEGPKSLSYRSVTCIYKDAGSGLWIGTHNGGVNYLGTEERYFKSLCKNPLIKNTLSHKKVWGICEDKKGNIWIGTDGGGLNYYSPATKLIKQYTADGKKGSISDNAVLCAYQDKEGDLWFGTYSGGLNLFIPESGQFKVYKHHTSDANSIGGNDVRVILQDTNGKIWIGTNQGGLNVLDKNKGVFTRYNTQNSNLTNNDIRALYIDKKQRLWIGTYGEGLFLFDKGKFHNYKLSHAGSNNNIIFSIDEDANGKLWLGTFRTGLVKFDPDIKTFEIYDENKGLANNIVHAIAIDEKNNIWLASNKGISRYSISGQKFDNYSGSDGLPSLAYNDGSVFKSKNGKLYFGSLNGLVYFNPNEEYIQKNKLRVIIEELRLFNKVIRPDSTKNSVLKKGISNSHQITFNSSQSVFSFQYAAIHFASPGKVHYSYMMNGIDSEWNDAGKIRSVTYSTLPSGDYIFKVRASLDKKIWSEPTSLMITIRPPFWRTWWAYGLYLFTAALSIYFTRRYRLNRVKMKRMIEIEQLEKEKLSEIYNLKINFFTNISHEFRTPLTLIMSPLEQIIRRENISDLVKNKLLSIYNHAHRLHHLTNQLMDFRKLETGNMRLKVTENDIVKFTYEVYHAFTELSKINRISFEFSSEVENLKLWFNQKHFETILFNVISNAFKYTPADGTISVSIKQDPADADYCSIHIQDNGKGISAEYIDQVFNKYYQVIEAETVNIMGTGIGLSLVKDLVELHKGKVEVNSAKEKGTEIILKFRLGYNHFSKDQIIEEHADSEHPFNYNIKNELATTLHKNNGKQHKHSILIIEDNKDIKEYIKSLFTESYKIYEAEDGEAGYSIAKIKSPSIIISDIMMPGIDGIELCKLLKNDSNTFHIPVVLLTARADDLHKLEGISIGADDYITKPFNAELLIAKINTIIRNQSRLHDYYTSRILLQPVEEEVDSADKEFLDKAIVLVEKNLLTVDFGIKDLMEELCMSQATLYRKIKQVTGESTSEFIRSVRVKKAAELIRQNKHSISQVAYDVGFSSTRYFRDSFFKVYKMTPSEYAKEVKEKGKNDLKINGFQKNE